MKQEYKELLLVDLCNRLPYEVILVAPNGKTVYQTDGNTGAELLVEEGWKPYLRPMVSMTEGEIEELLNIDKKRGIYSSRHLTWHLDGEITDYLNKNMFDWRGLIPMGLALEAPEGMYN